MRTSPVCLALLFALVFSSSALTPNLPAGIVTSQLTVNPRVGTFDKAIRDAPRPVVPPYGKHPRGRGAFIIDINVLAGSARNVRTLNRTGSELLDDIAISALRKWQFQPHMVYKVTVPIEFDASWRVKIGT